MLKRALATHSTKVITANTDLKVVLVGIGRERLFGADTIEEALKIVDSLSRQGPTRVLAGVNDQEFKLMDKSVASKNKLKGRFMSPLVVLCRQRNIPIESIGRRLSATSSRLSLVAFSNPIQFYKGLWLGVTKSWGILRAPSARKYVEKVIPKLSTVYLTEGSEYMALKVFAAINEAGEEQLACVVPMENYFDIVRMFEPAGDIPKVDQRLRELESHGPGLWMMIIIMYLLAPSYLVYRVLYWVSKSELIEFANFETQGIALGTWVRDKRRD